MFKKKQEQKEQELSIKEKMKVVDFMPNWTKAEAWYKEAEITDADTKKKTGDTWPRLKPMEQIVYENWLDTVVNPQTGDWYPQRDKEGNPVKNTGGKYLVSVITRVKDGKEEFLLSKGFLKGFDASGEEVKKWVAWPEKWTKTNFTWKKTINEKTMTFDTECQGPSGTEDVYELPFTPQNVDKLYEMTDKDNVQFVIKDEKTQEATQVLWSSIEDTLKLFKEKSFDYLKMGDYIPAPVKAEMRAKAEQQGLIPKTYSQPLEGISKNSEYVK